MAIGHYYDNRTVLPRPVTWPASLGIPPKPAAGFQPRIQAQEILRKWEDQSRERGPGAVGTVLIAGPAGVGKTQLAASVFEDADTDVDLRLWVTAESRTSVVTAFAEAADRVQAPVPEGADADQKAMAFLNWLSVTERSWLVVFDNASNPGQLAGLWPTGRGRVLATTYRQDAALVIGAGTTVRLGVFTPEEAQAYIERRIRDAGGNGLQTVPYALDEAEELARDLGFLPVALAQAVSVILYQGIRCRDYRADFADRAKRLSELFPDRLPADEYGRTVATTWSLAMEQTGTLTPAGLASRLVQLVAVTDPAGALEAMFLAEPSLVFSGRALRPQESADDAPSSVGAEKARSALRDLHALSLIEHQTGSPATVRMHGLTQRAVLESITAPEVENAVRVVADSLNAVWTSMERDALALLLSNTEHLIGAAADALWIGRPHTVLYRAGLSMLDAGMVVASIRHFEWLSDQAKKRMGPDDPNTLASRNNLALAYREAGNLAHAIELFEQTLTDAERVLGKHRTDTLTYRNNLASAYQDAGDLAHAIELFEQTLTDTERVLGKEHPDTLLSRNNLAAAYLEAGDLARAMELFEQTLTDTERILGKEHPDTLLSRNNLAVAYRDAGDLTRAVELFEQILTDRERVLGNEHPDTLVSRSNLASAYREAGDLARAVELFEQILTDRERVLGNEHPDTLVSRSNLASAYGDAGDLARAMELFEQTLTDTERVLGKEHPDTLASRNNLAGAYRDAGDPRATELFEQTLTDTERVLGKEHPDTLLSRNNLASAYRDAGDLARAVELFEQTLTDRERVLGKEHPSTLVSRSNLASAYRDAGDLARAVELFEQTASDAERVLGKDHPGALIHRNNLASACLVAGDLARAVELFEQTASDAERVLGKDHPGTLIHRNNLASACLDAGDLARAVELFEQTASDAERVLGKDHPHTLAYRKNLARAYREAGHPDDAIPHFYRILLVVAVVFSTAALGCIVLIGLDLSVGRPISGDLLIGGVNGILAVVFWVWHVRSRRRRPGAGAP
ncbi:tetratricopeptide repeat protein [Arthrobacter sp. OV608]|uniref:tetratricopeptide repeat protein n=1 Tax=Arthrobacter sp. OV608 TaxID=1882768 RepID=UPI0008D459FF|nr:tetratricopeptide repeat protein [Arthrobacter sp. OV608]SEQ79956.1 Tetratricopeptide repeat-containing protein [Arthrobacter sp. OV608]